MQKYATALSALQQAGIVETEFQSANLNLRELPTASLVRIHSLQAELTAAALRAAGMEVPVGTGDSVGQDPALLCLRPGEWLMCSTSLSGSELQQRVQASLPQNDADNRVAVLDVSDGLAVLQLSGAAAPWLLAKLSSLDFVGARNAGQHAARTRMGQAAVVVSYHALTGNPAEFVYDLVLDRSIVGYLWGLLLHSAAHAEELLATSGPALHAGG